MTGRSRTRSARASTGRHAGRAARDRQGVDHAVRSPESVPCVTLLTSCVVRRDTCGDRIRGAGVAATTLRDVPSPAPGAGRAQRLFVVLAGAATVAAVVDLHHAADDMYGIPAWGVAAT